MSVFDNAISITFDGKAVAKIAIGDGVLWEAETGLLPSEYQQVEYIETDGNQYIDTLVVPSDYSDGIVYNFCGNRTGYYSGTANNYLFGCLSNGVRSGNASFSINSQAVVVFVGASSSTILNCAQPDFGADFELTLTATSEAPASAVGVVNGTSFARSNTGTEGAMPSESIYLLWCRGVGSTSKPFWGKLYSFTMDKTDGTPIRNFVPCYRKSDNVAGLYDTVEGRFYTNEGSGLFTVGADI